MIFKNAQYAWLSSNRPTDINYGGYLGSAQAIKDDGIAAAYISPEGNRTSISQRPVLYLNNL